MPATETKYTYEQLIEKLVRADMTLALIPLKKHAFEPRAGRVCITEDPDSRAECDCGADAFNRPLEEARRLLKL